MESFMRILRQFLMFMVVAVIAIVLGVVIGDYGAWYFSWLIGTATIVLFAAAGGVLFDAQEKERAREDS
jgi:hypothetical protein